MVEIPVSWLVGHMLVAYTCQGFVSIKAHKALKRERGKQVCKLC